MSYVLTLIAPDGAYDLLNTLVEDLRSALPCRHPPYWLADHACDIPFLPASQADLDEANRLVASIPASMAIDALIQPVVGRRKRMLIADMDSTIIEQECLDEVAKLAGIGPQIAAITERAMRGELEFEAALRERIGLLHGFPEARLQDVLDNQITLTSGAKTLTATMRANGSHCVLVSGGFDFFTSAIALRAGFNADHANSFIIENGMITGVAEPILGRSAKLENMEREAAYKGIGPGDVIAVGDGANDLAMLKAAGLGVAFHAKPIVAAEAAAKVNHSDLTALLFYQGYKKTEFSF